jgi:hypothetical protein
MQRRAISSLIVRLLTVMDQIQRTDARIVRFVPRGRSFQAVVVRACASDAESRELLHVVDAEDLRTGVCHGRDLVAPLLLIPPSVTVDAALPVAMAVKVSRKRLLPEPGEGDSKACTGVGPSINNRP